MNYSVIIKQILCFYFIFRALRRFDSLKDQLQYLTSDVQYDPNHRVSIIFDPALNTTINRDNHLANLEKVSSQRSWISSLSNVLPAGLAKQKVDPLPESKHPKNLKHLKAAFSEFYLMLVLLQNYQVLNFTGFRKILKKHDKVFETKRGEQWR